MNRVSQQKLMTFLNSVAVKDTNFELVTFPAQAPRTKRKGVQTPKIRLPDGMEFAHNYTRLLSRPRRRGDLSPPRSTDDCCAMMRAAAA
jgi:hypothetical protein